MKKKKQNSHESTKIDLFNFVFFSDCKWKKIALMTLTFSKKKFCGPFFFSYKEFVVFLLSPDTNEISRTTQTGPYCAHWCHRHHHHHHWCWSTHKKKQWKCHTWTNKKCQEKKITQSFVLLIFFLFTIQINLLNH